MAKIDKDDRGVHIINVDGSVGVRGTNARDDVMVVQAMLHYLMRSPLEWTEVRIPTPDGALGETTVRAILDYQQWVRGRQRELKFWVAKDGEVVSFERNTKLLYQQQWTILAMNFDCGVVSAALGDGEDHIDAVLRRWPVTVGAALGLEPVRPPIYAASQETAVPGWERSAPNI